MPEISELTAGERELVAVHLGQLIAAGVDVDDPGALGKLNDVLYAQWKAMPEESRDNPNAVINLIGIGLGECLVRCAGLEWVVESSQGAELAAFDAETGVLIYPTKVVAQRWADGVESFVPDFVEEIIVATDR